jgi:tetratricopeptide (TPR) repeat protein
MIIVRSSHPLGEPHNSLAYIMYAQNWDWASAEREYKKSIEVDPQYAVARHWYFIYLTAMKRYPEAIAQAEMALELDPLLQSINYNAAMTYMIAGQYERGFQQLEKAIELDPSNPVP